MFLKKVRLFLLEKTFTPHPLPSLHVRFHPLENKTFFPPFSRGAELNEVGERVLGTVHWSGYGHSGLFGRRLVASLPLSACQLSLMHWGGGGGPDRETPTASDPLELVCDKQPKQCHVLEKRSDVCV